MATLKLKGKKDFKLLALTDIHISGRRWRDTKAIKLVQSLIDYASPDLIVITGDAVSSRNNLISLKKLGSLIESYNIPYALTYGNHDSEGKNSKRELSEYLLSLKNSIFNKVNRYQEGNYYIDIVDNNNMAVMRLIMMDSNDYIYNDKGKIIGYDNVDCEQIDWYRSIIEDITDKNGKVMPSLLFLHIPLIEYKIGYIEAEKTNSVIYGRKREEECHSKRPCALYDEILRLKSTKGIYAGHDHLNDYCVDYKGVRLTYVNACDYVAYGNNSRKVPHGGTLIHIGSSGEFNQQQLLYIKKKVVESISY